jgi:hypothetical protein
MLLSALSSALQSKQRWPAVSAPPSAGATYTRRCGCGSWTARAAGEGGAPEGGGCALAALAAFECVGAAAAAATAGGDGAGAGAAGARERDDLDGALGSLYLGLGSALENVKCDCACGWQRWSLTMQRASKELQSTASLPMSCRHAQAHFGVTQPRVRARVRAGRLCPTTICSRLENTHYAHTDAHKSAEALTPAWAK